MTLQRKSLAVVAATALFCAHALAQSTVAPAAAPATPAPAPAAPAAGTEQGKLAWYGSKFAGRKTASGQRYDPNALTMAHKTLPFGTRVKVTNLANKRSVELIVNDRGPTQANRIGDVSLAAAKRLGMDRAGIIDAEVTVLDAPANKKG